MASIRAAALAITCGFACGAGQAFAGSVLQPGITIGTSPGAPKDEGLYFNNTGDYGQRTATQSGLGVDLPVIAYASPLTVYGTRLQFVFSQPLAATTNTNSDRFFANSTLLAAQLARSIGSGLGISYLAGIRAPEPSAPAYHEASFEQRGAISYTANGFDLTANVINGLFPATRTAYPGWVNVDLTATKTFDKVEIGPVAFGSTDLNAPFATYKRQGQIAVGGLVGYHFAGSLTVQLYLTRDVLIRNYSGYDTRGWVRVSLPLYEAPSPPQPIRARY